MPITPLHFGVMAPINHFAPGAVSTVSFILVNLWIDGRAIESALLGLPLPGHPPLTHSLMGALGIALIVSLFGFRSRKWIYGAFLGAVSHVLLDTLVHSEMLPFFPLAGNPAYMGWMEPLSIVLVPLTIWFTAQCVSGIGAWFRRRHEAS